MRHPSPHGGTSDRRRFQAGRILVNHGWRATVRIRGWDPIAEGLSMGTRRERARSSVGIRFSSLVRVFAIARASACEIIRERILYVLLLFVLSVIGAALLLGELSVGQERRIVLNLGLGAIRALGSVMAVLIGVRLLEREFERRTIYVLLAKPVRRWEVILGKFCGGAFVLLVSLVLMTTGLMLALALTTRVWAEELRLVLPVVFLFWLQFLLAAAIALVFATFSTPVLATVFAIGIVIIGQASREFWQWAEALRSPLLAFLSRALYYLLPNMQGLTFTSAVVHKQPMAVSVIVLAAAYAALYLTLLLLVAAILFHRREFR